MNENQQQSQGGSIYELLPQVQRLIGAIGKDNTNQHQRYNFRGIDDVLNVVGPALAKVGVTVTTQVVKHDLDEVPTQKGFRTRCRLKMRVTFWGQDGTFLQNCTVGEAHDHNGDKATNKAMSVAFKYACFMGLAIPVEPGCLDDSDHDDKIPAPAKTPPPAKKAAKKAAATKQAPARKAAPARKTAPAKGSGPHGFEAKPAHPDQKLQIACAMHLLTDYEDEEYSKAEADRLKTRILGMVNKHRPAADQAATVNDLYHLEAEKVLSRLMASLKQESLAATWEDMVASEKAKREAAAPDQEGEAA